MPVLYAVSATGFPLGHVSYSAVNSIDELPSGRTLHTCRRNCNGFKQIYLRYFLVLCCVCLPLLVRLLHLLQLRVHIVSKSVWLVAEGIYIHNSDFLWSFCSHLLTFYLCIQYISKIQSSCGRHLGLGLCWTPEEPEMRSVSRNSDQLIINSFKTDFHYHLCN